MTHVEITRAEQARWQRRSADHLTEILESNRGLPLIAWTVAPAGSVLVGHVNGLMPGAQARRVFCAWHAALRLGEYREAASGTGTAYLHAAADSGGVRVRLTATVFDDEDGEAAL
jgi:hypothetical protein